MSPCILNTAVPWDKEIHPTTPEIQNNITQKEAVGGKKKKKGTLCTEWILRGSGSPGPQLQAQAYCLL